MGRRRPATAGCVAWSEPGWIEVPTRDVYLLRDAFGSQQNPRGALTPVSLGPPGGIRKRGGRAGTIFRRRGDERRSCPRRHAPARGVSVGGRRRQGSPFRVGAGRV